MDEDRGGGGGGGLLVDKSNGENKTKTVDPNQPVSPFCIEDTALMWFFAPKQVPSNKYA